MDSRTSIDITWKSFWRVLIVGIIAVAIYYSVDIWVALFSAIIISSALNPFVTYLERIRIPRVIGSILVFLVIMTAFAAMVYAITPVILEELDRLLEQFFPVLQTLFGVDIHKLSNIFNLSLEKVYNILAIGTSGQFIGFSWTILGYAALIISALAMSFYLTVDHKGVERFLRAVLPDNQESRILDVFLRARKKMGYWFQAQLLLSFFVALLVFIGLSILGVEHAVVLSIVAGTLEIIPFVGPVFTGSVAVAIAFSTSTSLALYTLLLFVIVQQIENHIFIPLFMNKAVGLHPVAVVISLLLGAKFFGIVGILIAVPATVILQEFIDDWTEKKAKRQRLV